MKVPDPGAYIPNVTCVVVGVVNGNADPPPGGFVPPQLPIANSPAFGNASGRLMVAVKLPVPDAVTVPVPNWKIRPSGRSMMTGPPLFRDDVNCPSVTASDVLVAGAHE